MPFQTICEQQFANEGKIGIAMPGIIQIILLKPLQYILNKILKTIWSVILDGVGYAECQSIAQNSKNSFNSTYSVFSCSLKYIISAICLICITMYSHVNTRA